MLSHTAGTVCQACKQQRDREWCVGRSAALVVSAAGAEASIGVAAAASGKLLAISLLVGWLVQSGQLPRDTAGVLSQVLDPAKPSSGPSRSLQHRWTCCAGTKGVIHAGGFQAACAMLALDQGGISHSPAGRAAASLSTPSSRSSGMLCSQSNICLHHEGGKLLHHNSRACAACPIALLC